MIMMKKLQVICLILTGLLLAASAEAVTYEKSISLDQIVFDWHIDGNLLRIRLTANTKGWVAIGFNPKSGMEGANLILGYVKRGKAEFQDAFGIRGTEHIQDELNSGQNNIIDGSGVETGGKTVLEFALPLKSSDPNDTGINPDAPTRVLLAFGPDRDNFYTKHKFRTALSVDLKTGQYK